MFDCAPFRNAARLLILVGIGDGTALSALRADQIVGQKIIIALQLPGDPPTQGAIPIRTTAEAGVWIMQQFGDFSHLPYLAGCDLVCDHPIGPEAHAARETFVPALRHAMMSRSQAHGNDMVDSMMGLGHAIRNAPTLLGAPAHGPGDVSAPVLCVAAGPSLARHLPMIRALQHKVIIVACDAVLTGLLREGITPHVVTPMERLRDIHDLTVSARGTEVTFAGLAVCHPTVIADFSRHIYIHAADDCYGWLAPQEGAPIGTGSSTGTLGVFVGLGLSRGPIYLVGHDLCADGPASHWDGARVAMDALTTARSANDAQYGEIAVLGNDGAMHASMFWWDIFRQELEVIAQQAAGIGRPLININGHTGDGARIHHAIHGPLPDPGQLPDLGPWHPGPRRPDRYEQFASRLGQLPRDARLLKEHYEGCRDAAGAILRSTLGLRDLATMDQRMSTPPASILPNMLAFRYILRSCTWSMQDLVHHRCRRSLDAHTGMVMTMESQVDTSTACIAALTEMIPLLDVLCRT